MLCANKLIITRGGDENEINKLNNIDKEICDQPIDSNELDDVVNSLKTNKSPGSDGLRPEFDQQYWKYLNRLVQISDNVLP